jgi:MFS family permease
MASGSAGTGVGPAGALQTFRELPLAARFVLLGVLVNQFGAFLQFFLVLYLAERGFSAEQAGIALGAYSVGAIVGVLFGGGISDRLGPRWTIVLSMGTAALFTLAVTALDELPAIVVVVAFAGAMSQASRPAGSALLFGMVPEARQVMAFAMFRAALNIGMVAGPLVAAWLSTVSWDLVFWVDAATSLAYCAIGVFLLPRDHVAEPAADEAADDAAPGRRSGYRAMLGDRRYLAYLLLMLANGVVYVQFFAVLPLQLRSAGYPTWAYGAATAISSVIIVGGELLVTRTTQTWPTWVAVMAGWVLLVLSRGGFGLPGGLPVVVAATALAAVGQIIGGPAAFAYPAKVAPAGAMGRYIGSATAAFGLGQAVGPVLGVLLWTSLGAGFWALCFAFGLAIVPVGIWGMRPARAATGPPPEPAPSESTTPTSGGGAR